MTQSVKLEGLVYYYYNTLKAPLYLEVNFSRFRVILNIVLIKSLIYMIVNIIIIELHF